MTLNIGPQHPATHGTLRIIVHARRRAGRVGRAGHGLHAPRLREAHRGPHLPAGHHADQPHRLAGQLRQRGAVHPRRREADGDRGAAAGPVDPHDPVRAEPHRQHRRCSSATWACSSARVTPAFYAFRDREYVLNQIEAVTGGRFHPNFDRIGGLKDDLPKGWIDETKRGHGASCATSATRWRTCSSATRSSRPAPAASASSRAEVGLVLRPVRAPTSAAAASTGTSAATSAPPAWPTTRLDWKVWTHPDGDSFARYWVRLQETREATKIVDQLLDGMPSGPIMAKVPRIIKVPEGEAWVATENPLGEMGYYVVSKGDLGAVPGEDPLGQSFNNVSIVPWVLPRRLRARRHHHPRPASTSSSGTSTDDPRLAVELAYWQQTILRVVGVLVAVLLHRAARSSIVFLFKMVSFMQSRLGPDGGRPLRLAAAARRGRQVRPEGRHRPRRRPTGVVFKLAPSRRADRRRCCYFVVPFGPRRRGSPTSTSASSSPSPCRRSRSSASSWPAGRRPTSTRSSAACVPPASSSPTSCRWCSPSSASSSRPAR